MNQKIVSFHLDENQDWVADLECGHKQHLRDNPPMESRPWVHDKQQRENHKGQQLNCKRCDEFSLVVAKAILNFSIKVLKEAEIESAAAAMCKEGQIELAIDRLKNMDLVSISKDAVLKATSKYGVLDT